MCYPSFIKLSENTKFSWAVRFKFCRFMISNVLVKREKKQGSSQDKI